ncbi:Hsp20 family protein [Sphingomonas rhizophila]|uniref:Hsp20 family protein n=1 Tax=Sphingomonas rhizophila TaxID=2071607 RepID=A0A7G9S8A4_9SPHN|nr:Hsp20 family protein [Sphingomonas rhizophila]QNN64079.1 Hsp20 family protein [Sphingomonas rhizophila]
MRSAFDFAPFRRSTIGFDRLFDMLENSASGQGNEGYPPFDLIALDDNHYRINLAVAGFNRDQIEITAHQNQLIVSGQRGEDEGIDYIHRGIATRSFERRFGLADHIKVTGADLRDGLLQIDMVREIPEAMKPRKIELGTGEKAGQQIELGAGKKAEPQTEAKKLETA